MVQSFILELLIILVLFSLAVAMGRALTEAGVSISIFWMKLDSQAQPLLSKTASFMSVFTPLAFVADVILLCTLKPNVGDATAFVAGTLFFVLLLTTFLNFKLTVALDRVADYLIEGFGFGLRVLAPLLVIGGFFFLYERIFPNALGDGVVGFVRDGSLVLKGVAIFCIVCYYSQKQMIYKSEKR